MWVFDGGCVGIVVMGLGFGCGVYEYVVCYVLGWYQFGKLIVYNQNIVFCFVDIDIKLEVVCLLICKVVDFKDVGQNFIVLVVCVKLYVIVVGVEVCDEVIQMFGGYGYIKEYFVEWMWCDNCLICIGEGMDEVQCLVISCDVLKCFVQD